MISFCYCSIIISQLSIQLLFKHGTLDGFSSQSQLVADYSARQRVPCSEFRGTNVPEELPDRVGHDCEGAGRVGYSGNLRRGRLRAMVASNGDVLRRERRTGPGRWAARAGTAICTRR
jgi:hypothetical protein